MARKDPKPEENMQHLNGALQLFGQAQTPILQEFADLQERRVERAKVIDQRLVAQLGEDHPRIVALRQTQARAGVLRKTLKENAARTGKLPELKPYEWMVYGQVIDGQGQPVGGALVRVFDKDRKYDDLLGYTTTDQFGDFHLVYHERAFYEPGEKTPELFLRVEDAEGQVLFSTEDKLRYQSGRVEYFLIELAEAPKSSR